jgi:hypothetical protein
MVRESHPTEPEYRFDILARDAAGNGLRLRVPVLVVDQSLKVDKLLWETKRSGDAQRAPR